MTTVISWNKVSSPIGDCVILATTQGICYVGTPGTTLEHCMSWASKVFGNCTFIQNSEQELIKLATKELQAYFSGEPVVFTVPLDLRGTEFQRAVWYELLRIPYGETRSYGDIARVLGRPGASRAVGAANGSNPVAIIVPCHRVIGSNGSLTGYGGGLPTKTWLLQLENSSPAQGQLWQALEQGVS